MDQMIPILEQKDVPLKFLVSSVSMIKIRINEGPIGVSLDRQPLQRVLTVYKIDSNN